MSKGWNENQIGWKFDDLFEEGYRFNNQNLNCWCIVSKDKANNEKEAIEYLLSNVDYIEKNYNN